MVLIIRAVYTYIQAIHYNCNFHSKWSLKIYWHCCFQFMTCWPPGTGWWWSTSIVRENILETVDVDVENRYAKSYTWRLRWSFLSVMIDCYIFEWELLAVWLMWSDTSLKSNINFAKLGNPVLKWIYTSMITMQRIFRNADKMKLFQCFPESACLIPQTCCPWVGLLPLGINSCFQSCRFCIYSCKVDFLSCSHTHKPGWSQTESAAVATAFVLLRSRRPVDWAVFRYALQLAVLVDCRRGGLLYFGMS